MTHNTREGIEAWKDINCLEGECAECGGTGEGADNPCSDHGETYPCYVCNGTGSWSVYRKKDVDKFLHQELQKAREEERENINNWAQYTFAYQPSVLKEWEAMYYRMTHDQSELDQPK